jgi:uncharacterized protein
MLKRILVTMSLLCVATLADAASFDCHKAATPIEKTICANAELSKLDSTMAKEYAKALRGDKDRTQCLRDGQRDWLSSLSSSCQAEVNCLTTKYQDRINLFSALSASEAEGTNFALDNISKHYRFALHLYQPCDAAHPDDAGECNGPVRLTITSKDDAQFKQVIYLDNIQVSFNAQNKPLANSNKRYEYQGVINVSDFNFDGREDFAVQIGNEGSYGGPNYAVYLNGGDHFVYNDGLSELTMENLGFFDIDPVKHELIAYSKDGCCMHQTSRYHVASDNPVIFERTIEDALRPNVDGVYVYTERLINGKWKQISDNGRGPQDDCEPALDKVLKDNDDKGDANVIACKSLPNEAQTGVAIAAYPASEHETGLDVFYVNRDNGKVLAHDSFDNAYVVPDKVEMPQLKFMHIDTGRYQIASNTRAIGIRAGFDAGLCKTTCTLLTLLVRDGDHVNTVLDKLIVNTGDVGDVGDERTLDIAKTSSHGFADIIVHQPATVDAKGKPHGDKRDYVLHYDGKRYVVPEELSLHAQ